jgi:sugar lactone lactonase YvrE
VVASGLNSPSAVAVDASGVYWADSQDGTINTLNANSQVQTLATSQNEPDAIALDSDFVYWGTYSGQTVMRVAKP